jgi:hypothetical protein
MDFDFIAVVLSCREEAALMEAWKSRGGAEASRSKEYIDSSFGVFEVDAAQERESSRIQELDERLQRLSASLHSASNTSTYAHLDFVPLNSSVQSSSRAFQYQPTRRQFVALPATQVLPYSLFIRLRCVCCQGVTSHVTLAKMESGLYTMEDFVLMMAAVAGVCQGLR